jgi:hypothetical protein
MADEAAAPAAAGKRRRGAAQGLAARDKPDGLAAPAGAEYVPLRELHGVIQVAMGWEGSHLYQFCLRAAHYGSCELSASSPEVTLAAPRLRKGARFTYEYDLNIPWRHEVRIEDHLPAEPGKTYPRCIGTARSARRRSRTGSPTRLPR